MQTHTEDFFLFMWTSAPSLLIQMPSPKSKHLRVDEIEAIY